MLRYFDESPAKSLTIQIGDAETFGLDNSQSKGMDSTLCLVLRVRVFDSEVCISRVPELSDSRGFDLGGDR